MRVYKDIFEQITSVESLFLAWDKFKRDKKNRQDVGRFEWNLETNLFELQRELVSKQYKHGSYSGFFVRDPKQRHIHKALVRDRIVHHALARILTIIFEPTFIPTSFSCRIGRGTHKGVEWLGQAMRAVSQNYTRPCFVLKCDVRKFFDSIGHDILVEIIGRKIKDPEAMWLMREIVVSYTSVSPKRERERERVETLDENKKGVPIGNLTSQLFANIYMNELDQFVKHDLKVKNYARYTDDFVIISHEKKYLEDLLPNIQTFLTDRLKLVLHPNKVEIRKVWQGIDFLGYVQLPHHTQVRTRTCQRIWAKLHKKVLQYKQGKLSRESLDASLQSYLGVLSHANTHNLKQELLNQYWIWLTE